MDTYESRTGEPQTLHKYLYAHSNPVSGIDPSGNQNIATQSAGLKGILSLSNIGTKTFKVGTKIIKIFKKFCNIGIKFANGFEKVSSKLPGVYILADVDFKYTGKGIKVRTRGRRSKRQRFRGSEPDVAILEFDIPISGPGERAAADLAIRVAEQAVLSLAFGGVNSSGTLNAINSVSGGFENIDEVVDAVKRICPQGRLKK